MNRGGSWNNDASNTRAANRNNNDPGNRNNNIGFRLASPGNRSRSGLGQMPVHHDGPVRALSPTIVPEPVTGPSGPKTPSPGHPVPLGTGAGGPRFPDCGSPGWFLDVGSVAAAS